MADYLLLRASKVVLHLKTLLFKCAIENVPGPSITTLYTRERSVFIVRVPERAY